MYSTRRRTLLPLHRAHLFSRTDPFEFVVVQNRSRFQVSCNTARQGLVWLGAHALSRLLYRGLISAQSNSVAQHASSLRPHQRASCRKRATGASLHANFCVAVPYSACGLLPHLILHQLPVIAEVVNSKLTVWRQA